MAYTVRVRGIEIVCDSLDDLDRIVDRYGGDAPAAPDGRTAAKASGGGKAGTPADLTVLRAMIEAGTAGVSSERIGHMLGTKGKGIPAALQKWAVRVGVTATEDGEVFNQARTSTGARGWRLKEGALAVAQTIL